MPYKPTDRTPRKGRNVAALCVAVAALAGPLGAANATTLSTTYAGATASSTVPGSCALSQPFAGLGDTNSYTLTGNGSFETGTTDWKLASGAQVISGTDPYDLTGGRDTHALSLPAGSVASNLVTCMSNLQPPLRFAAVNTGYPGATLEVDALTGDPANPTVSSVAMVSATSSWHVVSPIQFSVPTGALGFRFIPHGGSWKIDDIYVDPFKTV